MPCMQLKYVKSVTLHIQQCLKATDNCTQKQQVAWAIASMVEGGKRLISSIR